MESDQFKRNVGRAFHGNLRYKTAERIRADGASLNQKRAVVNDYRELPDGKTEKVFNAKETILARECQDKIEQAFHDWVMGG